MLILLMFFLHTRSGLAVFLPIILSHTPIPTLGKDKKQAAPRRPHVGRTSIRDVIVML